MVRTVASRISNLLTACLPACRAVRGYGRLAPGASRRALPRPVYSSRTGRATSGVDLLSARLGGGDVRMLGVHINTIPYSIVGGPEIGEPGALRGKRIAVSRVGTSSDFAVRYALERVGLRADSDVTIVGAGN